MPKKKVEALIKLQVEAGNAAPTPPVGPALGQHKVNSGEFCKAFNEKSLEKYEKGTVLPVKVTVYEDKSFTFEIGSPPATFLLKKIVGLEKGSSEPGLQKVGVVKREQLEEVARTKWDDLSANDMDAAVKIIAGSARSLGLKVEG